MVSGASSLSSSHHPASSRGLDVTEYERLKEQTALRLELETTMLDLEEDFNIELLVEDARLYGEDYASAYIRGMLAMAQLEADKSRRLAAIKEQLSLEFKEMATL